MGESSPKAGGVSAPPAGEGGDNPSAGAGSVSAVGSSGLPLDISALANILNAARGPILDRLARRVPKLSGDGTVEILEWLTTLRVRALSRRLTRPSSSRTCWRVMLLGCIAG